MIIHSEMYIAHHVVVCDGGLCGLCCCRRGVVVVPPRMAERT